MKKTIILAVLALALSFTVQVHAQLVLSTPPVTASGPATSDQVASVVAATGATLPSGAVIKSVSASAVGYSISATWNGETISVFHSLATGSLPGIISAGPALPSGKTASQGTSISIYVTPSGARATVRFSS